MDGDGAVVGISSLRFAENFALALSGADAQASVDKIFAGKGSEYTPWPGGDEVTQTTVHLLGDYSPKVLNIPSAHEDRTIDVTVPADLPILVVSGSLESIDELETMGNLRAIAAVELGVPQSYIGELSPEQLHEVIPDTPLAQLVSPGVFRFKVPADQHLGLVILTNQEDALDVPVTTSTPVVPVIAADATNLELGNLVDGTVGTLVPYDTFRVHLDAGQHVRIQAGSPSGDMRVVVKAPDGADKKFEDSRVGLYGVDVDETYEAPLAGDYLIEVGQVSDAPTGYHLTVSKA